MSPTGAEVIRKIRSQVEEVDPSEVREHLGNGVVLVDVRESEEWDAGHIPGAKHVPRGYLESRIEGAVADRDQRVVLYCASGPALGARRQHAARAAGLRERRLHERRHHAVEGPRLRRRGPEVAHQGAARALLAPPARARDRARGPDEAARVQGAAARRRRARLADRALPRGGRRRHARHRRRRRGRPLQPPAPGHPHDRPHRRRRRSTPRRSRSRRSTPTWTSSSTRPASTPRTSWRSSRATT